jgi:hypothetical protein
MQYKVPQKIDMEDKLIGPLTLWQFIYVLVGGMIIYAGWLKIAPISRALFFIIAIPVGLITFALAFVKVQDQPFTKFIMAFIQYLARPKNRIWQKETQREEKVIVNVAQREEIKPVAKKVERSELEQLAHTLDTAGEVPKPSQKTASSDQKAVDNQQPEKAGEISSTTMGAVAGNPPAAPYPEQK